MSTVRPRRAVVRAAVRQRPGLQQRRVRRRVRGCAAGRVRGVRGRVRRGAAGSTAGVGGPRRRTPVPPADRHPAVRHAPGTADAAPPARTRRPRPAAAPQRARAGRPAARLPALRRRRRRGRARPRRRRGTDAAHGRRSDSTRGTAEPRRPPPPAPPRRPPRRSAPSVVTIAVTGSQRSPGLRPDSRSRCPAPARASCCGPTATSSPTTTSSPRRSTAAR